MFDGRGFGIEQDKKAIISPMHACDGTKLSSSTTLCGFSLSFWVSGFHHFILVLQLQSLSRTCLKHRGSVVTETFTLSDALGIQLRRDGSSWRVLLPYL